MPKIIKAFCRIGQQNTTEHAIAQVGTTMLVVLAVSPYGLSITAIILLAIAVFREVHGV